MDYFYHYLQIVLLGIVEGVTEFLPISSTGHLLIAEHWLGTTEPDLFNVVIQAGAILAVVFIYWPKLLDLVGSLDRQESRDYLFKIALSFIVTTLLVLVLTVKLKLKLTESLTPVAWATFIGGLVIFAVEFWSKNLYPHEEVSWFEAVLIGAGQVVAAIFPGASRSGTTIMAGLAVGIKRPSVTQFTFLVGIPTMFAASAYDTLKARKELHGLDHQVVIDTAIGFVVSGVVAFFVVKWLLRFVQSHTFNGFAIYRVILGGGLLIGLYTHAIPDITTDKAKPSAGVIEPAPIQEAVRPTVTATNNGPIPVEGPVPTNQAPLPNTSGPPSSWVPASMQQPTNASPPVLDTNSAPATNVAPAATNAESAPIAPGTASEPTP